MTGEFEHHFSVVVDIPSLSHPSHSQPVKTIPEETTVSGLRRNMVACAVLENSLDVKLQEGHQVFPLMTSGVALPTCPLAFAEARLVFVSDEAVQYCPMT